MVKKSSVGKVIVKNNLSEEKERTKKWQDRILGSTKVRRW
jgi:hypothetical protein